MPLELTTRFKCNECGVEYSLCGTVDVQSFPFIVSQFGVKQPPPGWTCAGTDVRCPQHSQRVRLADSPALIAALRKGN